MIPAEINGKTRALPLDDLFEALKREGFQLRPDDYLEVVKVLEVFKPQTYSALLPLLAPLIVTSDEEQEKFDKVFEAVRARLETPKAPLVSEKPKKPSRFGGWHVVSALIALAFLVFAAFFWPGPDFKRDIRVVTPYPGPHQIGDTLLFAVDSSLHRAAGRHAQWEWVTPDGQKHTNEPRIAVRAEKTGKLEVGLKSRKGKGLLFTSWADSLRSVTHPICDQLPKVLMDSARVANTAAREITYEFSSRVEPRMESRMESRMEPRMEPRTQTQIKSGTSQTQWLVDGQIVARNKDVWRQPFRQGSVPASHDIRFVVIPDTTIALCFAEAVMQVTIPGTGEQAFSVSAAAFGPPIVLETNVAPAYIWVEAVVVLTLLVLIFLRVRLIFQKEPPVPTPVKENPLARFVNDQPPFEIPLKNREAELIVQDQSFYQTVRMLRQPTEGERRVLDMQASLKTTIQEGGMPTLTYKACRSETEYLFLIDRSQVRSQQVTLFEYLCRTFVSENVCAERFFFHGSFDHFTNEKHSKGFSLAQLADRYRNNTLIIWTNGYPLLNPVYPVVEPAIQRCFAEWESKAILTPVPFGDWNTKERALQSDFLLLPADMTGQLKLIQALADKQLNQDSYLNQHREDLYATTDVDFEDIDQLQNYTGSTLFQWLAAIAIYPRLRWEIVVELGQAILPASEVNFTNLLKLSRISWMREGSIPDYLRLDLLKGLTAENEAKARKRLLEMLQYSEQYFPGEHFYDAEKHVLQTANQFLLFAHNPEDYGEYRQAEKDFKELYQGGNYPDGTTVHYLTNPNGQWDNLLSKPGKSTHTSQTNSGGNLDDYFKDQTNAERSPQPPSGKDKLGRQYLIAIAATVLVLAALFFQSSRDESKTLNFNQRIPVHILLDSSTCVNASNINGLAPRWTIALNDTLLHFSNMAATRLLPLKNLVSGSATSDSMDLQVRIAVNDTTTGEVSQFAQVRLTGDSVRISIVCKTIEPDTGTSFVRNGIINADARSRQYPNINSRVIQMYKKGDLVSIMKSFSEPGKKGAQWYQLNTGGFLLSSLVTLLDSANRERFVCIDMSRQWVQRFNSYQATEKNGAKMLLVVSADNAISIRHESAPAAPVTDPKTGAAYLLGTVLSIDAVGTVSSVCNVSGTYLVNFSTGNKQRTMIVRNVGRNSAMIGFTSLDNHLLNRADGLVYFNKMLNSTQFNRFVLSARPKEPTANESAQKEPPANDPTQKAPELTNESSNYTPVVQAKMDSAREFSRVRDAGINAYQKGNYAAAIRSYDEALRYKKNDAYVLDLKGYSLFKLKQYDEAVKVLLSANESEPNFAWAYFDLARVYCAMGNTSAAQTAIQKATGLQPDIGDKMLADKEFMGLCGKLIGRTATKK